MKIAICKEKLSESYQVKNRQEKLTKLCFTLTTFTGIPQVSIKQSVFYFGVLLDITYINIIDIASNNIYLHVYLCCNLLYIDSQLHFIIYYTTISELHLFKINVF